LTKDGGGDASRNKGATMTMYPTDQELEQIRTWDLCDLVGLFDFIKSLWTYADVGYWAQHERKYWLDTGGLSGNEDIIETLKERSMFWMICWYSSKRGGHYVFEIPQHWTDWERETINGGAMTAREIVEKYLRDNGYDGLCGEECGCSIDDLMPCDYDCTSGCEPGYKHLHDDKCQDMECEGDHLDERCWCMRTTREAQP